MHHNHLEGLLKQITGPSPGASDSVGLGWALRNWSNRFPGGADSAGPRTTLGETLP